MSKRKLLTGIVVAVAFTAGFGSAVLPASADQAYVATLVNGTTTVITLPDGTDPSQVHALPDGTPIIGLAPVAAEPAAPAPSTDTAPAGTPSTTPTSTSTVPTTSTSTTSTSTTPTTTTDAPGVPQAVGDKKQKPTKVKPKAEDEGSDKPKIIAPEPTRSAGGAPTASDPTYSLSIPGAAAVGVPNFFIDKFRIPPFLLPIYQAAGIQYGIRWEILAAINEIESDYGRNPSTSSAGAEGWMQFLPSTWKTYGVDANRDGKKDPGNPVDAIFAAARYLKAAGGDKDIKKAIFAYNHADWYVDSVMLRARLISGLPADLVGSLTGLTEGHFPVHAKASYADDLTAADAKKKAKAAGTPTVADEADPDRRSINIYAKSGSPVIAVQDGKITDMGTDPDGSRFVKLRDGYGNSYTYRGLKSLSAAYPVPKPKTVSDTSVRSELGLDKADPAPKEPATAGTQPPAADATASDQADAKPADASATAATADDTPAATDTKTASKQRIFAHPKRPQAFANGGKEQVLTSSDGVDTFKSYFTEVYGLDRKDVVLKPFHKGAEVIAGTILGKVGTIVDPNAAKDAKPASPHLSFAIRPAGRGAPRIDPKPILDGWKLLESTAIYRAAGQNALLGSDGKGVSIGEILLMGKEQLAQRVLNDPHIDIYACGRRDIEAGIIDRRVLATLAFLSSSGLRPTVTALECGHGELTTGGNVSEHSTGDAVDIGAINGIRIEPKTQGEGTITDITIRRLLTLQGAMKPHQIISLMTYPGTDNTLALPDHYNHIHVGFRPDATNTQSATLQPKQWSRLLERLGKIPNPTVSTKPSPNAIPADTPSDSDD